MPNSGTYILTNVGFSKEEKPTLLLQGSDKFVSMYPLGETFTITFNLTQRFCIGWRDMTSGERSICPDHQMITSKYEQCPACQRRTGFNPAFYHAASVSAQQEARNLEPHILYLAHFGPGVMKIGISHANRGYARLLEQGARSAIVLGEFTTAHIARQYEAQIASLAGVVEAVQANKKAGLAVRPYDSLAAERELIAMQKHIETSLDRTFDTSHVLTFDDRYFPSGMPDLNNPISMTNQNFLSGVGVGMLGSILFCTQDDIVALLPLKKYVGYHVELASDVVHIEAPARQISLF